MHTYDLTHPHDRVIGKILAAQAAVQPDAEWLVDECQSVTFNKADRLVNRYANGLAALGVKPGMVVAMIMEPSIEVVLVSFAVSRIGAIFMTVSTDFSGRFLANAIKACQAHVLIVDAEIAPRVEKLGDLKEIAAVFVNGDVAGSSSGVRRLADLLNADDSPPKHAASWLDPVQVWWSSGTTGAPKGVMHSHSSVLMQVLSHDRDIRPGDTLYSCTPVYLGSSWTGTIYPSLVHGVRAAIDKKFSVSKFWDRVNQFKATHAFTLGAMHMHLWNAPERASDRDNTLRRFAAMPMAPDIIRQFKARFGIEDMRQGYGTSETFRVFDETDHADEDRSGAVLGYPVPHLDVALLDEEDMPVPEGQAGEICVRPKEPGLIFSGYFRDAERTAETWRSLWHHTGDMAMRGSDGLYRFADRKKDYIRYKGRNMSMFEVEDVVMRHPAVKDVAAFGIESKELESESELMISVVVQEGSTLTAAELARYINTEAPYYFVPRYIDFAAKLPRNDHGRLVKQDLRDRGVSPSTWDREATDFVIQRD
jgi:crotonobetaine/carnitine-CoA ligase